MECAGYSLRNKQRLHDSGPYSSQHLTKQTHNVYKYIYREREGKKNIYFSPFGDPHRGCLIDANQANPWQRREVNDVISKFNAPRAADEGMVHDGIPPSEPVDALVPIQLETPEKLERPRTWTQKEAEDFAESMPYSYMIPPLRLHVSAPMPMVACILDDEEQEERTALDAARKSARLPAGTASNLPPPSAKL